jgi:hypothetical protein
LFFIREINLRGYLRVHVTVTHDRREDGFNTTLETAFDIGVFQLRIVQIATGGIGLRQQMTALINQRHVTRRQTGDGAGNQVNTALI